MRRYGIAGGRLDAGRRAPSRSAPRRPPSRHRPRPSPRPPRRPPPPHPTRRHRPARPPRRGSTTASATDHHHARDDRPGSRWLTDVIPRGDPVRPAVGDRGEHRRSSRSAPTSPSPTSPTTRAPFRPARSSVCVPGERVDGHDHAADAVAAGAVRRCWCSAGSISTCPSCVVADIRARHGGRGRDVLGTAVGTAGRRRRHRHQRQDDGRRPWSTPCWRASVVAPSVIGTLTGARTTPEATDLQAQLRVASSTTASRSSRWRCRRTRWRCAASTACASRWRCSPTSGSTTSTSTARPSATSRRRHRCSSPAVRPPRSSTSTTSARPAAPRRGAARWADRRVLHRRRRRPRHRCRRAVASRWRGQRGRPPARRPLQRGRTPCWRPRCASPSATTRTTWPPRCRHGVGPARPVRARRRRPAVPGGRRLRPHPRRPRTSSSRPPAS